MPHHVFLHLLHKVRESVQIHVRIGDRELAELHRRMPPQLEVLDFLVHKAVDRAAFNLKVICLFNIFSRLKYSSLFFLAHSSNLASTASSAHASGEATRTEPPCGPNPLLQLI